jgi:FKBP-type peptidyl-prolyl cis-trans isomerase (trigger factor)
VDLPQSFIDDELNRMRGQFEQQLASLNVNIDQYLQQSGKTMEQLEEQWKPQAVKQATMEAALAEIANHTGVNVSDDEVEQELAKADSRVRAQFSDPQQRYFLMYALWRQKVLRHILDTVASNEGKSQKLKVKS